MVGSSGSVFASGYALFAETLKAFLPPEPSNVADYVAAHRWLSNAGGGYVGRWNHDMAPYLIAPMEELSNAAFQNEVVVGPGQCGKTEIARNWLFTTALSDPADMLWYSASEPLIAGEVKKNISRMVMDHPQLARIQARDSIAFKRFGSMSAEFLPCIMGTLISKSAPRIVGDEFDAICKNIPNAYDLIDVRRVTFGARAKFLALSHPDAVEGLEPKHWDAGIMQLFARSDRRIWYWQCPECGAWSSPNPTAKRVMELHYDERAPDDEIQESARLACPVNGCLIEDSQRYGMNLSGRWIGLGQDIDEDGTVTGELVKRDTAGFWIVGAMSPFGQGGIGRLARIRVEAERRYAVDRDRKVYRETMSKSWGVTLAREKTAETIDATVLAERAEAELKLGVVANGVRFITVMIDIQIDRFELLARGWMAGGRSVVVDKRVIPASPSSSAADWDDLLKLASMMAWPLEGQPAKGMRAVAVGYDSAGADGVTLQAYDAWRRLKRNGGVRSLGRIEGRPVYNILPLKGASSIQAPRLQIVFPNAPRGDRMAQARGEVPIGVFNPNLFKDDLNGQLILADDAAWSVRFPKELAAEMAPHPWFEQLVAEQRLKNGRWDRKVLGRPNEALDLMVGSHVLAFMMGIQRIRWDAPPAWAKAWAENVNVVAVLCDGGNLAPGVKDQTAPPAREISPGLQKRSLSEAEYAAVKRAPGVIASATRRIVDSVPVRR